MRSPHHLLPVMWPGSWRLGFWPPRPKFDSRGQCLGLRLSVGLEHHLGTSLLETVQTVTLTADDNDRPLTGINVVASSCA